VATEHDETKVEPRLYIYPHAGGSADFYVPFARAFSGTTCVAVQYPGKRTGKDLSQYTSIPELADRLCTMLKPASAPAGQVAKVMDEARKAGIKDIAISAQLNP